MGEGRAAPYRSLLIQLSLSPELALPHHLPWNAVNRGRTILEREMAVKGLCWTFQHHCARPASCKACADIECFSLSILRSTCTEYSQIFPQEPFCFCSAEATRYRFDKSSQPTTLFYQSLLEGSKLQRLQEASQRDSLGHSRHQATTTQPCPT